MDWQSSFERRNGFKPEKRVETIGFQSGQARCRAVVNILPYLCCCTTQSLWERQWKKLIMMFDLETDREAFDVPAVPVHIRPTLGATRIVHAMFSLLTWQCQQPR